MQNSALTVIGSVLVGVAVPTITYYLTRKKEIEADWRKRKLEHYTELFSAISGLAVDNQDVEATIRLSHAVNTIGLVAPQYVVDALMGYYFKANTSEHDLMLNRLILAVRKDIGVKNDNSDTFCFRLVGNIKSKQKVH
ncbi:MAG: hypothetical protein ABFD83_06130 [Armatimonadota bacterium]